MYRLIASIYGANSAQSVGVQSLFYCLALGTLIFVMAVRVAKRKAEVVGTVFGTWRTGFAIWINGQAFEAVRVRGEWRRVNNQPLPWSSVCERLDISMGARPVLIAH